MAGKKTLMHPSRNDMPEEARQQMVAMLNQSLADCFDLYSQTKQAHWNVKGMHFSGLHEMFDRVAAMIFPYVDTIAERTTALGGVAMGTARMAAANTQLEEFPTTLEEGRAFVEVLADRYAAFGAQAREGIDKAEEAEDIGTSDLYTDLVRDVDQALYFLESHLQE